jgi:hypothetical protein
VRRCTFGPIAAPLAAGTDAPVAMATVESAQTARSLGSDFSEVAGTELRARIDEAYRVKYGRYGSSYVTPMASDSAAETTLQLEPVG